jgi:hypothetical protein
LSKVQPHPGHEKHLCKMVEDKVPIEKIKLSSERCKIHLHLLHANSCQSRKPLRPRKTLNLFSFFCLNWKTIAFLVFFLTKNLFRSKKIHLKKYVESIFFYFGNRTLSITWITPLSVSMSALRMFASLTLTDLCMCHFAASIFRSWP